MELTLTTPAILFSVISLLYLGYTNRFVAISNLIRSLKVRYLQTKDNTVLEQISNLRTRVLLIRNMQFAGIFALILSAITMIFIYFNIQNVAHGLFALSMISLVYSMTLAAREIWISVNSLNIELDSIQELKKDDIDDGLLISHNIKKITKATKGLFEHHEEHK